MPSLWPTGYWGPLLSCNTGKNADGTVNLTCASLNDLIQTILNVVAFAMTLALFVLAPLFFAWGGLMMLIAGGSPQKMASGKKILTGTVIGIIIVLAAYLIVKTFVGFLGIAGVGGFS